MSIVSSGLMILARHHLQDIPAHFEFLCHLKNFDVHNSNLDCTTVDHVAKTIPYMPQPGRAGNPGIQRGGAVSLVSLSLVGLILHGS